MNWKSKKTFQVFFSIVFGVLVILGSAKVAGLFGSNNLSSDNEWVDGLSVLPGDNTLTLAQKGNISIEENATGATTTTALIARRLVSEYLIAQKGAATSTLSDIDARNIGALLAQEITLPSKKECKLSDLNVSLNNSHDAYTAYATALNVLVSKHTATEQAENDLTILVTAMNTNDAKVLDKLKVKVDLYQTLIKNLVALKVPSSLATIHLHLIQNYEMLRSATVGFQSMLSDPALGTVALTEYREGSDGLALVAKEFDTFVIGENAGQ